MSRSQRLGAESVPNRGTCEGGIGKGWSKGWVGVDRGFYRTFLFGVDCSACGVRMVIGTLSIRRTSNEPSVRLLGKKPSCLGKETKKRR